MCAPTPIASFFMEAHLRAVCPSHPNPYRNCPNGAFRKYDSSSIIPIDVQVSASGL